jgi:hypothetical protein
MADSSKDKDLDETKRIMERLVKTPPDPKTAKPKGKRGSKAQNKKPAT